MTREEMLKLFLKNNGWADAERVKLASDASSRTYERLIRGNESVMLMNSPLSERPDRFILIDKLIRDAGVHAPQIMAADTDNGFLLLEDFGDDTFTRLLKRGADETELYRQGLNALIRIQEKVVIPVSDIDVYSPERLMSEVMLLPNWFCKYALPDGIDDSAVQAFQNLWIPIINQLSALPKTLVLLDYHADNLMMTKAGDCGVLDFQDARLGPVTYDLMSLLEDERRDVSADVRQTLLKEYFRLRPEVDTPAVRAALPLTAMQRHTKVVGIFMRLFQRDRKEKYLSMIPLVWELIERHLDEPVFADYKTWLDTYVPQKYRHTVYQPKEEK